MGAGGVGFFAIQGAAHAGALYVIAVDPVEKKRTMALSVGATHGCASIEEATVLAQQLTHGNGADATIITLGTLKPEHLLQALQSVGKNGTVVCTACGNYTDVDFKMSVFDLTVRQKRIQGSMSGGVSPTRDIPRFVDMYLSRKLKLDEAITRTYSIDEINQGYEDLKAGKNLSGVIVFDS